MVLQIGKITPEEALAHFPEAIEAFVQDTQSILDDCTGESEEECDDDEEDDGTLRSVYLKILGKMPETLLEYMCTVDWRIDEPREEGGELRLEFSDNDVTWEMTNGYESRVPYYWRPELKRWLEHDIADNEFMI